MGIVPWDPFLMKFWWKKYVCESREQYMGSTENHCPPLILLVKEVVGPVHSARDPLTDNILVLLNKKNKNKRRKIQTQHQKRVSKRILKLGLSCCLSRIKELFIKNKKNKKIKEIMNWWWIIGLHAHPKHYKEYYSLKSYICSFFVFSFNFFVLLSYMLIVMCE